MTADTLSFVSDHPECFERSFPIGHITGSAWIINETCDQVILLHHRKLDRWFQPGGHSDGNPDTRLVALREAQEETGLKKLQLLGPGLFDVDVHLIPERKQELAHFHYDLRFLILGDSKERPEISEESNEVQWLSLPEAKEKNDERSITRMIEKTRSSKYLAGFSPQVLG